MQDGREKLRLWKNTQGRGTSKHPVIMAVCPVHCRHLKEDKTRARKEGKQLRSQWSDEGRGVRTSIGPESHCEDFQLFSERHGNPWEKGFKQRNAMIWLTFSQDNLCFRVEDRFQQECEGGELAGRILRPKQGAQLGGIGHNQAKDDGGPDHGGSSGNDEWYDARCFLKGHKPRTQKIGCSMSERVKMTTRILAYK